MFDATTGPQHYEKAGDYARKAADADDPEIRANLIGLGMLHAQLAQVAAHAHPALAANSESIAASVAVEWNRVAGMTFTQADRIRQRG